MSTLLVDEGGFWERVCSQGKHGGILEVPELTGGGKICDGKFWSNGLNRKNPRKLTELCCVGSEMSLKAQVGKVHSQA